MDHPFRKIAALGLIAALVVLPAALDAQTGRGAHVLVTLKNGTVVGGELIAVKPDSLILLTVAGKDQAVSVDEVKSLKVVRRSKAGLGTILGVLVGGVGGGLYGHHEAGGDDEGLSIFAGAVFFGGIGGLIGLGVGIAAGLDAEYVLEGRSAPEMADALTALSKNARMRGGFPAPARVREPARVSPSLDAGGRTLAPEDERRPQGPRFRIMWSAGYLPGDEYAYVPLSSYSFRFLGEVPPAETGTYSSDLYMSRSRPQFSLGCFSLAYEWSRRWSSEVEIYWPGDRQDHRFGDLEFTSSVDGLNYWGMFSVEEVLSGTVLLAGVTFRPFAPEFLQPHVLELGMAAGPALMKVTDRRWSGFGERPALVRRISRLAFRARAAYDYYFVPALSVGAYAEYRWLRARIPAFSYIEDVDFYVGSLYTEPHLSRTVEVNVPGRTADLGGWSAGLRFGVRF